MNVNRISCYALALSCLLASCKDEMKDEEMPTVSITSPKADTKVWLETTLAAEVMDNQGVSKVEFYLDGDLIGEDTEAPYELSLDTKQYEDGTYVLRTVAFDGANNRSEAERDVEIQNTLLTVDVENNHFETSEDAFSTARKWITVSDVKGNILQTEEIKNGTKYTFDRPEDFSDSLVSVTFFYTYKYNDGDYQSAYADTYYGISPDRWTLFGHDDDEQDASPTITGEATGSFIAPGYNYAIHSPRLESLISLADIQRYEDDSIKRNFFIDLYQNTTQMYLATFPENEIPKYKIIQDIEAGDHYDLTSGDYKDMRLIRKIDLPSAENAFMYARGKYSDEDQYSYVVSESKLDKSANALSLYQPENMFTDFNYRLYVDYENFSYYRYDEGQLPSSYDVPELLDFSLTSTDRSNFKVLANHPRDYTGVDWYEYQSEHEFSSAGWYVHTNGGQEIQFSVPQFPKVIADEYPSLKERMQNLPWKSIELKSRNDITSFKDYMIGFHKYKGLYSYKVFERLSILNKDNKNARRATKELPQRVQDELKKHRENRW